eukprot:CAMPEP_0197437676 /NCGR_PEP_ID=MMETSP1175-20131217/4856_1 /TAXON_ID=1003142 /ORGANISM="Triceratium dubium, Strain CCMP147" /LENGTH=667 /DNA_ID=CAMNT_0042967253 /DNA_START=443 /DNA_END=2446 /DNA_ORIENTATION=-
MTLASLSENPSGHNRRSRVDRVSISSTGSNTCTNANTVGNIGLIETWHTGGGSRVLDEFSQYGASAVTGATSKPGRCVVHECCVTVRSCKRIRKKTLLHPMRVDIPSGSMTAIIGPAGSGKTTLLNYLAGSLDSRIKCKGVVNLIGSKSYLGAETNLHGFYNSLDYLKHYDRLSSGKSKGDKSLKEIEGILDSLGILSHRRKTVVGDLFRRGLSPGERRRLDLGLMVLGAPDTLFCEEPTGNMDSETSMAVMNFLKGYCSQPGRRVIVTMNTPSSLVWNMIDNVILISEGRIIFEGPRFDMEAFFANVGFPTPKRFNQAEHYLSVVSSVGMKKKKLTVEEWAKAFKEWQEETDQDLGDPLADDIEVCFPIEITSVTISRTEVHKSVLVKKAWVFIELVKRYMIDLFFNPGTLWVRFVMYTMLALFIGLLFFGLGDRTSYTSIQSRTSLLFYSVSFFIFMVVAVLPFRVHDKAVVRKEVFNGYYHPITHHIASTLVSLLGVLILALMITVIIVPMAKLNNGMLFFLDYFLSLYCAEALAQLVALLVNNYIIGIVGLAGLFGFFMLLMGFMLVPSEFPIWLRWAYNVPFHTYTWRTFMWLEFSGPDNVYDGIEFPTGMDVLKAYEIDQVDFRLDMIVLFCYGLIIHIISMTTISVRHGFFTRKVGQEWS